MFRVKCEGSRVQCLRFFRVKCEGSRVQGLGFVSGLGFRVIRVYPLLYRAYAGAIWGYYRDE